MDNTLEKTSSSSLSVVEKKSGGCVGIFFQLFDWNRRMAKKKLFSSKLLPPVRLKQASKKLVGVGKQSKLRLIADENSGGFPKSNVDKEQKQQETRAPGLVARLMGLESMPALQRDKSKKSLSSSQRTRVEPNLEKDEVKHESRPQKLRRTSVTERQPVTKLVPEKLHPFKCVLSKSRKQNHPPKLPSPLKSPKNAPTKRPSKLIGAASRILEPSSRLKCALTYTDTLASSSHPLQNSVMDERARLISGPSVDCYQSSCRNCGYLLDNLGPKHAASEKPSILANCSRPTTFYKQDGDSLQSRVKFTQYKIPFSVPVQRNSEALPLAFSSSIKAESGIHTFQARASGSLRPKAGNVSESKNFSSKAHLPVGMENDKFGMEKRISYGLKDPVPPGRKRRPANVSRQVEESAGFVRSQRNFGSSPVMPGKHANVINDMDESRDNVAPFSFTSPVKYKYGVHEAAERRNKYDSHSGGNGGRKKLEKPLPLTGDALGALLQQKLKELNYEKDGFESKASGKTTSMILQELICALTTEKQRLENNLPVYSDRRSSCCNYSMLVNSTSSTSSQDNAMAVNPSVEPPLDSERLSPGSVLESYFSAESCHSTSLDESLASINNQATNNDKFVNDIVNHVSEILSCDILASHGPKGKRLDQAEEALLNSELILHNASISDGFVGKGCPIKHLIIDELETLMSVLWMNFGNFLGVEDGKEEVNQLKIFVFDSVIEYLGERFGEHCEFGSSVSRKLPLRMNMNTLIFEIVDVVRRWDELSRYDNLDKLVEREMGFSVKDWTECENEGFETGLEISRSVLQVLVDEVVVDLWTCVS